MSDRTLVLLKPDAVRRKLAGQIISRIESKDLTIVAMDLRTLDADTLARHYEDQVGNERALRTGARLISAYELSNDRCVCVITEAEDDSGRRHATTVLLPETVS